MSCLDAVAAPREGVGDLRSRVLALVLADGSDRIAAMVGRVWAEPAVKHGWRHVPAAAVMRDLDQGRLDAEVEQLGIVRGLVETLRPNVGGQQNAPVPKG